MPMGTPKAPAGENTIPSFRQRMYFQQLKAFTKASPRIHPGSLAAHEVLMHDARQLGGFMKVMILNFVKFAACMVLAVGLSVSASASCGDSLSAMAALAASVHSQSRPMQQNSQSAGDDSGKSMVGLWHIQFTVGGQTIQEAYQLWNAGGTEIHNPNVDPRGGASAWGCGSTLRTGLTSSRTACGRTTRAKTSSEPPTSAIRSLWVRAAKPKAVP